MRIAASELHSVENRKPDEKSKNLRQAGINYKWILLNLHE